jgi:septal ring factor EnvC (AmiA/AmiB activator)
MEELQNRQQEINQKLAEAIRNMEEMRCTGNNVNVELKRQDETLEKIDQTLDAIDQENKSSKKMLSSIGSFWGFIKNRITGWKYKPAELPKQSTTTTE